MVENFVLLALTKIISHNWEYREKMKLLGMFDGRDSSKKDVIKSLDINATTHSDESMTTRSYMH